MVAPLVFIGAGVVVGAGAIWAAFRGTINPINYMHEIPQMTHARGRAGLLGKQVGGMTGNLFGPIGRE